MVNIQRITSYSLASYRPSGATAALGTIILNVDPPALGVSSVTALYFGGDTLGPIAPPTLYVRFPADLFTVHSEIFRTEQPLFVSWDTNAQNQLTVIQFRTTEEWPGEGPADQTP